MVDYIADYYKNIENFPVLSQVQPGYLLSSLPQTAPARPEPFEVILGDVSKYIFPGMTHWLHPKFFAFFPATISSAAFVGDMLCNAFNSVGFNWLASPASTELEMVVMDWLASMLKLPTSFMFSGTGGGVIHGTTSEAILCTLVAARNRAMAATNVDNPVSKLVVYASDQTHSTFAKACKMIGIPPKNIRLIPTTVDSKFALPPCHFRKCIKADVAAGLVPLYLCVTVGTTSTAAIDPLEELLDIAGDYDIWVHVDAAYAGSACICPEFRYHLNGVDRVDSLSIAPHKWLLTYLDCCCLWMKNPSLVVKALGTNPEYLKNEPSESNSVVDYKDWQIGTGRRFKSLRLWFVLRTYGITNLQNHIRSDIGMARYFESLVRSDPRFEIVAPPNFALVCFRFNPTSEFKSIKIESLNRELLDRINSTGQVYMTHTIASGVYMLRFAVGTTLTEKRHVVAAWKVIEKEAQVISTTLKLNT
uniref:Tryptophan decarboxylase n=2 Tax=Chenopodium quinoa TaxID=63459 RepID=A0A803LLQ5_CHEQI